MKKKTHIPFYLQIKDLLAKAIASLDEQGREEVLQFILKNQNEDGGFQDRGGASDLYYSLFGMLMLRSMGGTAGSRVALSLEKLSQYASRQSYAKVPGFIEKCCLILLQKELNSKGFSRVVSLSSLGQSFWKERASINLSYRSFVLFLTLDAILPISGILKLPAKSMMEQTYVDEYSPCSEVAAKVFLQKMLHHPVEEELKLLYSFGSLEGGFRAFSHLENADMLSTAVALFALDFADAELRLLKPNTLEFIQSNYQDGAFLSGDGDMTTDVEYTFYGLLAFGVLVNR